MPRDEINNKKEISDKDEIDFNDQNDHIDANDEIVQLTALLFHLNHQKKPLNPELATQALILAAKNGVLDYTEQLLNRDANPNLSNADGDTPLHFAAMEGHLDIVEILLKHGADPNCLNDNGQTPMALAIYYHHWQIAEVLAEKGADPLLGPVGKNAMDIASERFPNQPQLKKLFSSYTDKDHFTTQNPNLGFKFTKQLIIDYGGGANFSYDSRALKSKWDKSHPHHPCQIIEGYNMKLSKIKFAPKDVIRIYVNAHGMPGLDFIVGGNGDPNKHPMIYYGQLAEQLAGIIGDHQAVVNLIPCGVGKGNRNKIEDDKSFASFAAKLHQSLHSILGRDIPVLARTSVVYINKKNRDNQIGRKTTSDLNLFWIEANSETEPVKDVSKQPGSKVVFVTDSKGHQIRLDAYSYQWKTKVLDVIRNEAQQIIPANKKILLQQWLRSFESMPPADIFKIIRKELANPKSVLKESSFFSALFTSQNSPIVDKLSKFLTQAEPIFTSKHTVQHTVRTGRKFSKD